MLLRDIVAAKWLKPKTDTAEPTRMKLRKDIVAPI